MGSNTYTVTRERDGTYHLHASVPEPRVVARVTPILDRTAQVIGWKLKPLVVMQGAVSRVWPDAASAVAATKLLTPGKAKAAIRATETGDGL